MPRSRRSRGGWRGDSSATVIRSASRSSAENAWTTRPRRASWRAVWPTTSRCGTSRAACRRSCATSSPADASSPAQFADMLAQALAECGAPAAAAALDLRRARGGAAFPPAGRVVRRGIRDRAGERRVDGLDGQRRARRAFRSELSASLPAPQDRRELRCAGGGAVVASATSRSRRRCRRTGARGGRSLRCWRRAACIVICPIGTMQLPTLTWRQGGRHAGGGLGGMDDGRQSVSDGRCSDQRSAIGVTS